MAGKIEIRPLTDADRKNWRRMWTAYLDFYRTRVDEAVYTAAFDRLLGGERHEFRGLIAHVEDRPAGLAHYLFHRHGWKLHDVCYLQDLWTEPQLRGRGVARALMRAVFAAADTAGAPDVWWLTAADNAAARRLYDSLGRLSPFVRYDRA